MYQLTDTWALTQKGEVMILILCPLWCEGNSFIGFYIYIEKKNDQDLSGYYIIMNLNEFPDPGNYEKDSSDKGNYEKDSNLQENLEG